MSRFALLALFLAAPASCAPPTASSVCVYNDAAFVLKWHLHNQASNQDSSESNSYPVWTTKCITSKAAGSPGNGDELQPVVQAVWGKEITVPDTVLYDAINATVVTYVCKGTTLDFSCSVQSAPPTIGNVSRAVGEFLLGFTEGLGADIGFSDCIADVNKTVQDITAVADFFEAGFNHKTVPAIAKAFELLGNMLKDFGAAITACVKDAAAFVAKMKSLAAALSGNLESVVKVVVDEAVHIWHDRVELSDDAKQVSTHWHAGDFKGAGQGVGDIVGVILNGLYQKELALKTTAGGD